MIDPSAAAMELIGSRYTLVLATADPRPWAAPVYYVYQNGRFYFFSSPDSRHVKAALAAGTCAATLFCDSHDWRRIEGLQMGGRLLHVAVGSEALAVLRTYVAKFPTVRDLMADAVWDIHQFLRLSRTQLYALVPDEVYYLNNRQGLGQRHEIALSDPLEKRPPVNESDDKTNTMDGPVTDQG